MVYSITWPSGLDKTIAVHFMALVFTVLTVGKFNYWLKNKRLKIDAAKDDLINVLDSQVIDLTMMSKIELGDDVIREIIRLRSIINQDNGK
jgi:hypothetical protein